jgi:ribosome-binding factor A
VRLTGDLRPATALVTVHDADRPARARVKTGLDHASGYLRRRLGQELSVRTIPTVTFEIDEVFEREAKVDALLRQVAEEDSQRGKPEAPPGEPEGGPGESKVPAEEPED